VVLVEISHRAGGWFLATPGPAVYNLLIYWCFFPAKAVWHGICSSPLSFENPRLYLTEVTAMKWETPAYNDIRFGFEVTMYINNK
jgi:coenzyme PQQ precursor peptide PqqA